MFDAHSATVTGPDGSTLQFVNAERLRGVEPTRITMRCRSAGPDWPVMIHPLRRNQHPTGRGMRPVPLRWQIDHGECLALWQEEGNCGLPDADRWDCLRQFVEDALLAWPDCLQTGPAPVSLYLVGGWYDGEWCGDVSQRLLSAPRRDREPSGDPVPWVPYRPAPRWIAAGPGTAVKKHRADNPDIRFYDAGYTVHTELVSDRSFKSYRVEYSEPGFVLRFQGTANSMNGSGAPVPDDEPDQPASATPPSGLSLWRRVRDALEGGLRDGEEGEMMGGFAFDRWFPEIKRRTAWGIAPTDFGIHHN